MTALTAWLQGWQAGYIIVFAFFIFMALIALIATAETRASRRRFIDGSRLDRAYRTGMFSVGRDVKPF